MKRKIPKIILLFLLVLLFGIGLLVMLYSYTPFIDRGIEKAANLFLPANVTLKYDRIEGNLLGSVRLTNLEIDFPGGRLNSPELVLHYDLPALLNGQVRLGYIFLDSPAVRIIAVGDTGQTMAGSPPQTAPDSLFRGIDLSGVPALYVRKMVIKNGRFTLRRANDSLVVDKLELDAHALANSSKIDVQLRYLRGVLPAQNIRLHNLSFRLIGTPKRLTLNQLELRTADSQIIAHGEMELKPHFRFLIFADTSRVEVGLIRRFVPDIPFRKGFVEIYGDFIGNPRRYTGNLFLSARFDSLHIARLQFHYAYRNRTYYARSLNFRSDFGNVWGQLQISPVGKNKLNLHFSALDLKKLAISPVSTLLNGRVNLDFNTWNFGKLDGTGHMRLLHSRYGAARFDTLALTVNARRGNWRLLPGSRLVLQKTSQFFVEGTLSRQKMLNVVLRTDQNNLDTLAGRLEIPSLGGEGSLNIRAEGPLGNPNLYGYFLLDSLSYADIKSYGVEGDFRINRLLRGRSGTFELSLLSGQFMKMEITDGTVKLGLKRDTLAIDSVGFYSEDNFLGFRGTIQKKARGYWINLAHFGFKFQDYRVWSADSLQALWTSDSLIIEDFVLGATGNGEIELRGILNPAGVSEIGLYFKNIQLFPFNQFIRWHHSMQGRSDISLSFYGTLKHPQIETDFDLAHFILDGDTVGSLSADVELEENRLTIHKFLMRQSEISQLSLRGNILLPENYVDFGPLTWTEENTFDLAVDFVNLSVEKAPIIRRFNFPVTGLFSGEIALSGTVPRPAGTYRLHIRQLQYQDYVFPEIKLEGSLTRDMLRLEYARLNILNSIVMAHGEKPIHWDPQNPGQILSDRRFQLFVKMQEDSLTFLNYITPEADLLTGNIFVQARLAGTLEQPEIRSGTVRVSDGTLYLSKVENPLTKLLLQADVDQGILTIQECRARWIKSEPERNLVQRIAHLFATPLRKLLRRSGNAGNLELKGTVDLTRLTRPRFDLSLKAKEAFVNYFIENAQIVFSTRNLTVSGRDTIVVQGDVVVNRADIELNLAESEKNLLISPEVRETPPYMEYRINLTLPGNFYVRSEATFNAFDMQLSGNLRILQEPKNLMEMYGNLEIIKGKYVQFEEFTISRGRVQFVNPKELPELDLYAEKRKYGFIFQLHVSGKLNNPVKEIKIFDLNTGEDVTNLYPETKDKIALLLFGVRFDQLKNSTGTLMLEKGQEVINQALISQIEQEARRFIGLDQIRLESQQGLIDFKNRRLNQSLEQSSLSFGKYLSPSLYLEYKTRLSSAGLPGLGQVPTPRLSWEAGNRIYLEYRINRNWSVSTFYEKGETDLIKIDISWRYEF